jgi:hypothetical protein
MLLKIFDKILCCRNADKLRHEMADEEMKLFMQERKKKPVMPYEAGFHFISVAYRGLL